MSLLSPTLAEPATPEDFQRQAAERVTPYSEYIGAHALGMLGANRLGEFGELSHLPPRWAPDEYGLMPAGEPPSPLLTKEQFDSSIYKRPGLEWEEGETEARADARAAAHDQAAWRASLIARSDAGWLGQAGAVAVDIGIGALDPTNYIPLLGPASKAAMVARFGRLGGALLMHGSEAALNTGLFEPLAGVAAHAEGRDYGWEQAGADILTNALGGAVLGTAVGEGARLLGFGHGAAQEIPKIPPAIPREPVVVPGEISGEIPRSQEIPRTSPTIPEAPEAGAGVVPRRPGQRPLRVDDLLRRADAANLALDQSDRGEPVDVGKLLANDPAMRAPGPDERPASRVGNEVGRQLAASGVPEAEARPQAALWQSFFDTMGRRAGVDPGALFDRYRVGVERGGEPEAGALLQARSTDLRMGVDQLVKAAEEQSSWKGWYEQHGRTLDNIFGDDAPLFQKILSATSQAASVKANVGLALKAYRQIKSGEPFTGYLPAVIKNLDRIKKDLGLVGAKIAQYGKANEGDTGAIAVDRHIAMLLFDTKSPGGPQIRKAQETIRAVATRLGWEPRQVQAALWAYNQVRLGTDPLKVESYDKILEKRADEIATLRSAFPDAGGKGAGVPGRGDLAPGTGEGEALYQPGAAGPRGSIAFAGDGRTVIRLFQEADASTFLHESGHLFARVMRDLAEREGAPEGIARDWRTLRDWLGLKEGEGLGVEHEEKLARGFEAYLRDGEAPTPALKGVFETIKGWLREVYKTLTELGVTPSPEVREVFARMLGGEEEGVRTLSFATAAPEPPHPSAAEAAKRVGKATDELATFKQDAKLEGYAQPLPGHEPKPAPVPGEPAKPEKVPTAAEKAAATAALPPELQEVERMRREGVLRPEDEAALAAAEAEAQRQEGYASAWQALAGCVMRNLA